MLESNVDDPRFELDEDRSEPSPWSDAAALNAQLTEPLDVAETIIRSRFGGVALLDALLSVLGEALASAMQHLMHH